MISRRTAKALGDLYQAQFSGERRAAGSRTHAMQFYARLDELYDFLYGNDLPAWMCNATRTLRARRDIKEWVMKLHTGETLVSATPNWSWAQRQSKGQHYLEQLAEDILQDYEQLTSDLLKRDRESRLNILLRNLELDGYRYESARLLRPEQDILDAEEEKGVLAELALRLELPEWSTTTHHLNLAEEHFLSARWDDSIGNSRKVLESILRGVAVVHQTKLSQGPMSEAQLGRPAAVRDYLESAGLLESKEKQLIAAAYGLLSETGSHPYMAAKDQARLLRQLSLTLAQFVMLRLLGAIDRPMA